MKKSLLAIFILISNILFAQNVGIGTTTPDSSAALDVHSINKGLLIPTMTTAQRNAIKDPAFGLLVFDKDKGTVMFYDGDEWRALAFTDENKTSPQSHESNNPSSNANFGSRVAISGNYAIIGAPKEVNNSLTNSGAAYIFFKTASGWQQQKKIIEPNAAANDYFGSAIAISGDYCVIASSTKTVGSNLSQGKVYVYKRNGTDWALDGSFTKTGGAAYEYFGWSVGITQQSSGTVLLSVGVPYSDIHVSDGGEVYCYKKTSSTGKWSFVQSIFPGDIAPADYFGFSISMDNGYMVVGAPSQDNATYSYTDAGAAYVYVFGGGVWTLQQKLSGTTPYAKFGSALSISENKIAVGAPWANIFTNTSSAVYLYKRTESTWANTGYLYIYNFEIVPGASQITASGGGNISIADITFGMSVSLDGDNLLIGSSGGFDYPNGGSSYYSDISGSVYFYKNLSGDTYTKMQTIKSDYPSNADLFGECVGVSDGKYVIANPHAIIDDNANGGNIYFGSVQ
jgi:hypothetical protein